MTDSNYTHILAIVDRSGSMGYGGADKEMTNALNIFFKEQAKIEGKCLVDYVQFDTEYEKVYDDRHIVEAEAVIEPRGGTALVDAIGRGTKDLGRKLAKLREVDRPGTVIVVVVTDGGENSSREFSAEQVKAMVEEQQGKWNWDYVFLGANIDAVATGGLYGFAAGKSMNFNIHNADAVYATSAALNSYTVGARGPQGPKGVEFTEEDRKKAMQGS